MKQWFCQEIYFRWRGVTPVCTVKWWKSVLIHLNQWVTEYTLLNCIESGGFCMIDDSYSHLRRYDLRWWELFSNERVLSMKKETSFQFKTRSAHCTYHEVLIVDNDRCEPHGERLLGKVINSFNCYYGNFKPVKTAFFTCQLPAD